MAKGGAKISGEMRSDPVKEKDEMKLEFKALPESLDQELRIDIRDLRAEMKDDK